MDGNLLAKPINLSIIGSYDYKFIIKFIANRAFLLYDQNNLFNHSIHYDYVFRSIE